MKILIVDRIHPFLASALKKRGFHCDEQYDLTYEKALTLIRRYDGLVIRSRFRVDMKMIDSAVKLKFIARAGSGMENINVLYAYEKGIICLNSPEGNAGPVGEHALGMLLSLLHNISRSGEEVKNGLWKRKENQTRELQGMTVGIIGYGHTGPAFAERLSGMGVNVLFYDKYRKRVSQKFAKKSTPEEIQKKADVLSIHVPLSEETQFLVDARYIRNFRKPFYLINTSRGEVIDTNAVVQALKSGKILGACLDVIHYEDTTFNNLRPELLDADWHYLARAGNVILTPHIAGQSNESMQRHAEVLVKKIMSLV